MRLGFPVLAWGRAAAVAAALLVTACAATRPSFPGPESLGDLRAVVVRDPPAVSPAAQTALDEARRLSGLGRREDAVDFLRDALGTHPGLIEGERLLQDLLVGTRSDAWLAARTRARLATSPRDADALYLAGRIEPSADRQLARFEAALRADPFHPWARVGRAVALERTGHAEEAVAEAWIAAASAPWLPTAWYFLGATAYARGASESAERLFEEAAARAPWDARLWSALAAARDDLDRREEAAAAAVEAVTRAPGDPGTLAATGRLLARLACAEQSGKAVTAVGAARADAAHPEDADAFLGRVLVSLGRFEEAEHVLDRALRGGAAPGEVAVPLRRARIANGRASAAVEEYLGALPRDVRLSWDARAPAWRELAAAAAAADTDPGEAAAVRLADALTAVGWIDETADVLAAALARGAGEAARLRAVETEAFRGFLADLGDFGRELRRRRRRGDPSSLDEVLGRIASIAAGRGLGADAAEGARVRRFALIGSFSASSDSDGAFRDLFGRRGMLLVAGERAGQGAEIVVGRSVSARPDRRAETVGETVAYDEHWVESDGLPDGLAGLRGGLAGLTLDRFVLLQLDVVRRGPPRDEPRLPYLERPAPDDASRRALDTPSDVSGRIEAAIAAHADLDGAAAQAVLAHERVHVRDAAHLLPVSEHLLPALWFGLSHGFSASSMERSLEARAAVGALADAPEPRMALAALLAFLPAEDGETAHVAAYRRVAAAAVDEILRDPETFPSIDRGRNVLQQMDRLSSAQARELGRRLVRRLVD